jgi:hypothetical protein
MAYLTLGPEFYKKEPELYYRILKRVNGQLQTVINSIHLIYFDSNKFGKGEYCIAVIGFTRFHRKPYFRHIIKDRFGKL